MASRGTILIVEDERVLRESLAELLVDEGFDVLQAGDGRSAYETLVARPVELVLSDVRMPGMDGQALLQRIQKLAPETPVVMLTAYGTVESAVAAMRAGALDYLLKPVRFDQLLAKVEQALTWGGARRRRVEDQREGGAVFHDLIGESQPMLRLQGTICKLAQVKSNVLIVGESGTGKELLAKAIHYDGITKDQPFVAVNCGGIPDGLVESELFGHRRGSFTGASHDRVGYFQAAHGGTLFLDEISSLPLGVQSSLLRALESREIVPVGQTQAVAVDVRIIAASNRDLEQMVRAGEFREDLLYRLNVVKLQTPPLRHRKEDIPLLVHHFLDKYSRIMGRDVQSVSNGAMRTLLAHDWPGNVRELENVIERGVIFAEGPELMLENLPFSGGELTDEVGEDLREALRQFERQHIVHSLRRYGNDKVRTARQLGIGVSSLYRKLDELNIPKEAGHEPGPGGNS